MAENENKTGRLRRLWKWVYATGLCLSIAARSPTVLGCLLAIYAGGVVIRWLWKLRV